MQSNRDGRIDRVPVNDLQAASSVACDAARRGAATITIAIARGDLTRVTIRWPADPSEWITWESCPHCGDQAAVGWSEAGGFVDAVEFDCPSGCRPSIGELARRFPPKQEGWTVAS